MSINEMEVKARELRQLQALIEGAQAEAEAIKDVIKAAMGDSESVQAGEHVSLEGCNLRQNRHQRPQKGSSGCGRAVHEGDCYAAVHDQLNTPVGIQSGTDFHSRIGEPPALSHVRYDGAGGLLLWYDMMVLVWMTVSRFACAVNEGCRNSEKRRASPMD